MSTFVRECPSDGPETAFVLAPVLVVAMVVALVVDVAPIFFVAITVQVIMVFAVR